MQRDFIGKGSTRQQVRLLTHEDGKVFGCAVVEGSTDEQVANRMCEALMASARFNPALDTSGNVVKNFHILELMAVARQAGS